jgi:O-antigen/teichoic acid export membrane protein
MSKDGSMLKRVGMATLNYGVGSILPKVIGFFLIPLYTAFLTPADYGIVDIVSTLAAFLMILMRLGLPGAVTRFYFNHKEGPELGDYVTTISLAVNAAGVVVGGLALAVLWFFGGKLVPGVEFWPFVVLGVISAVLTSNSDLQRRLIQVREQSSYSAKLSVATAAVNILLSIALVAGLRWGALGLITGVVVANAIFFIQARLYLAPDLKGRFRRDMLADSSKYAIAILPGHIVSNLAPVATRSVLATVDSLAAVGVFGIANRFASPLGLLAAAFNSAYLPVYFALRKEGTAEAHKRVADTAQAVWLLAMALFIGTVVAGPPVVKLMTHDAFDGAGDVLVVLAIGFLAQMVYLLFAPELFYVKTPWIVPVLSGVAAAVSIGVTWLTANRFGAIGLAAAQSAGFVVQAVLSAIASHALHPIPHAWLEYSKVVLAGGVSIVWTLKVTGAGLLFQASLVVPALALFFVLLLVMKHTGVSAALALARSRLALGRTT